MSEIRLVERDYRIIKEIDRWRICQGKHIKILAGFDGQRACDRRLRKLIEAGYIRREKILYGVAGIYRNTGKAKQIENIVNVNSKIRVEQLKHDITVLDVVAYFHFKHGIAFSEITTEIELHRKDGFSVRKHRPDFIFEKNSKKICVEVELTLKSRDRFEKNIETNFKDYDTQIWVVPDISTKIARILNANKLNYPNIEILELKDVKNYE